MKRTVQAGNILILIVVLTAAVLSLGYIFYLNFKSASVDKPEPVTTNKQEQERPQENNQLRDYTSRNLKISFKYPEEWYVEEKDFDIMITSYQTKIGENESPSPTDIKIFIDNFSGCFPTLEEDLIKPACGQGAVENKIVSKEVIKASGGEFLKYKLDSPDEYQRVQYFFRKGDMILQIEKHPDPSQFEREFEDIATSIQFL